MTARRRAPVAQFLAAAIFFLLSPPTVSHGEPLHEKIDRLIEGRAGGALSPPASDAEFVRRIYLDLAGRIPTASEARAFLDGAREDKRARLVDRLLSSPDYSRRMKDFFHVMFLERRGTDPEWERFLDHAFSKNMPWDEMVEAIVNPDAEDPNTRGSAYFFTKRLEKYGQNPVDMPRLVRDVGRLFLGVDLQCAQCHNHPFVDDYHQVDYQGLYAFVGHISTRRGAKFPALDEKLLRDKVEFVSVFTMEKGETGPRLPGGEEVAIPVYKKGEEYLVPPDRKKRTAGVPRFRPLEELGKRLPTENNTAFARNIANRLWWMLMGRGIVHPLDWHHSGNPPSHPELIDLLAVEVVAHDFDIKWMLRQIARTRAYGRSSLLPAGVKEENVPEASYRVALEKPLSAEQLLFAMLIATGEHRRLLGADYFSIRTPELEEGMPPEPELTASEKAAEREELAELRERFKKAFANPPQEPEVDFHPSVRAALFMLNDGVVLSWLEPREDNLAARLLKIDDAEKLADELYLSILSRRPSSEERGEVTSLLQSRQHQRTEMIRRLIWALLASTEASVNH